MSLKQIAVFVENRQGALTEITDIMANSGVDIRALSISETQDFGILRMIVNDLETAKTALTEAKCVYSINDVVGVEIPDKAGSMAKVIRLLADDGINIEYVYAFVGNSGKNAWVVIRVKDNEKAETLLKENGYRVFRDVDIKNI